MLTDTSDRIFPTSPAVGSTSDKITIGGMPTQAFYVRQNNLILLMVRDSSSSPLPQLAAEASMPSVDVATAGRVAGASVFLLCLLSLVLWLSFGLFFIAPLFSILGCLLGGSFYLLSFSVRREWANRDGRGDNRK